MNRRGFIKTILVAASAPAMVRASSLMPIYVPKFITPPELIVPGYIMAMSGYDARFDRTVIRLGAFVAGGRLGVDMGFGDGSLNESIDGGVKVLMDAANKQGGIVPPPLVIKTPDECAWISTADLTSGQVTVKDILKRTRSGWA